MKQPVPEKIRAAWERGAVFLTSFQTVVGEIADIGDRDDGWALVPYSGSCGLFGNICDEVKGIRTFPDSGYTVCDFPECKVIFDHGPLGMPPSFGHGHADCLSVQFFHGKVPVLIAPGTFCYNCPGEWRNYFRSTSCHNTVTVDNQDQAEQQTPFMWAMPFNARLLHVSESDDGVLAVAKHDGYKRLSEAVEHFRGIMVRPDGFLLVWDMLKGAGRHCFELNWHISLEWELTEYGDGCFRLGRGDAELTMAVKGGVVQVVKGQSVSPLLGWFSPVYGERFPSPTVHCSHDGDMPHEFLTIIGPGSLYAEDEQWNPYLEKMRLLASDT